MMGDMNTSARSALHSTTLDAGDTAVIEQLTLLPGTSTPTRFRLSKETRERGLRHVAELLKSTSPATIELREATICGGQPAEGDRSVTACQ